MIHIANWLLTRKCNLNCNYCKIVKNYSELPDMYPRMDYYYKNEMTSEKVIENLSILKNHNPNMFHIFYGGEPMLRNDIREIIDYCNNENIFYTIISNNSDEVEGRIEKLFSEVKICGFTSSVDPIYEQNGNDDSLVKSRAALLKLKKIKKQYPETDVVAEITCTKNNVHNLYRLVKELADNNIHSSITAIDPSKNEYYDFSSISSTDLLLSSSDMKIEIDKILADESIANYIHMRDDLLQKLLNNLPSEYDCKFEDGIHNMTIDADGSIRLCLRIKGVMTPLLTVKDCFVENEISETYRNSIINDKNDFCNKCNWTCTMMSELLENKRNNLKKLLHKN